MSQFELPASTDTVYRYFTEAGIRAYGSKDLEGAEQLFEDAVNDAERQHVSGPNLAVMLCNLAAVQRDTRSNARSLATFRLALSALKQAPETTKRSMGYMKALNHIALHYAALLRLMGRAADAKFIEENPSVAFSALPSTPTLSGAVDRHNLEVTITSNERPPAPSPELFPKSEKLIATIDDKSAPPPPAQPIVSATEPTLDQTPTSSTSITFRQTAYYTDRDAMYEALKTAIYYLSKGVNVTMMLDRGAVQVTNQHDSIEIEDKNKLVGMHRLFQEFLLRGGVVLAAQRWADKYGYVLGRELSPGVRLLTDEQMADELLQRRGSIINY